ncbi:MAG TPA: transcription elongation factor GreA [Candidatus Nanopelagicales bacterium]|nr:transcription elongation factor GreA [Candidatus Nanopelagicales bacterium]
MSNTVYLSSHGIADARAELERLTAVERPEVVARIVVAREFGDLKENAEYETARKDQSILEGRIERLTALLRDAVRIEGSSTSHVSLGTAVTVEDDLGEETYTIVGSHESSPAEGRISSTSPVGRALMGRRAGDTVTVTAPGGSFGLRIVSLA